MKKRTKNYHHHHLNQNTKLLIFLPFFPSGTKDGSLVTWILQWGHHSPLESPPVVLAACCSRSPSWRCRCCSRCCRSSSRWAIFHRQYREAWIFFLLNISDFLRRFCIGTERKEKLSVELKRFKPQLRLFSMPIIV